MANKICVGSYLALIVLCALWYGLWFPSRLGLIVSMGLLGVGAMMLFTASRGRLVWAGMVVMLLFIHGVTEAMVTPAQRLPALLAVSLSLLYFSALYALIRQSKRGGTRAAHDS